MDLDVQLWGCASTLNVKIIQRTQKNLKAVVIAPWYVSNDNIHTNLSIPIMEDVIRSRINSYYMKLDQHPNSAMQLIKKTFSNQKAQTNDHRPANLI